MLTVFFSFIRLSNEHIHDVFMQQLTGAGGAVVPQQQSVEGTLIRTFLLRQNVCSLRTGAELSADKNTRKVNDSASREIAQARCRYVTPRKSNTVLFSLALHD